MTGSFVKALLAAAAASAFLLPPDAEARAPGHGVLLKQEAPGISLLTEVSRRAGVRVDRRLGWFWNDLARHGRWIQVQPYGWVWQPRTRGSWQPYTDGRWVRTRQYGWMWQSNEPFGWATYHYGSWDWDRRIGWYWVPGYRWAPAWVVWRTSGDYIGWAPVRARFGWGDRFDWIGFQDHTWWDDWYADARYWCFVPSRHIGSRHVAPVIIDRSRNITIINNTTTVNNITIVNNGTTIVNTGVDQTILAAEGNTPPPVVDVTSVPSPDEVRPDNGDADPGLVEIVQPQIDERPPPVATAPVRDSDPVILADPVAPLPEPVDVPVPEANQAARGMDEAPAPDEVFAAPPSPVEDAIAMPELQPGPDTAYAAEPVPAEAMPGEPLPAEVFTPAEPDFVPQPEPEYAAPAEPEFAPPPEPAYEPPPQEFAPPPEMAPPPPPPPQPAPPPPPAPVQLDANGNPIP